MQRIHTFLDLVIKQGGSDLHLVAGNPPRLRLHGVAYTIKYRELSAEDVYDLVYGLIPEQCHEEFKNKGNADFSYEYDETARFRVNVFQHIGQARVVTKADIFKLQADEFFQMPRNFVCRL